MDESSEVKVNPQHKFISTETQFILAQLARLDKKIMSLINSLMMSVGLYGFIKITPFIFYDTNTQEFVAIKLIMSPDNKDILKIVENLRKSFHDNNKLVICYINRYGLSTDLDFNLKSLARINSGDKALDYFSVGKKKKDE